MWPLMRISAMFVSMPLFSMQAVPARIRLILAVAVTFVVMPLLPPLPTVEMFSPSGFMMVITQVMIGLTSGFIVQLVFAAVTFAGQVNRDEIFEVRLVRYLGIKRNFAGFYGMKNKNCLRIVQMRIYED